MSMADFEAACRLIAQNQRLADFGDPQPDDKIALAETQLGITFPPTYREFLRRFGCGGIGGDDFYGLTRSTDFDRAVVPNAIGVTLRERKERDLPPRLVIINELGEGTQYALDTGQVNAAGECPVVVWGIFSNADDKLEVISEDFGQFFRMLVEESVEFCRREGW